MQRVVGVGRVVVVEHAVEGDRVGAADDRDFECGERVDVLQVIDHLEQHLTGQHTGLELQRVELAGRAVVEGAHSVLAVTPTEQVCVVAQATVDGIVAQPTIERVVAGITRQGVSAVAAVERVVAIAAKENVVVQSAVDHIVATRA